MIAEKRVITPDDLQKLLDIMISAGRRVLGPVMRDGVITYDDVGSIKDFPIGLTDEQTPGGYRLVDAPEPSYFGFSLGPQVWKKYLHSPRIELWRARREGENLTMIASGDNEESYAFIGVRACELAAISKQDHVLTGGEYVDRHYKTRRENTLIIAVNCGKAGGTCFCHSMGTGPEAKDYFDIALTELTLTPDHLFLVEAGSPAGHELLQAVGSRPATDNEIDAAKSIMEKTKETMGKSMPLDVDVPQLLSDNLLHPRWEAIAERCLSCANCTMVCPTCFCTTVDDLSDLAGESFSRERRWDSCFTMDFSYLHGGGVRNSVASRYRQWMTHKLSTWVEQFGSSGCVGCGRCITWCPVGIDITEEVKAIADSHES
jgi:sulfhydrogenase subunit beta (sulfur reductase)